jgi:hypothetical protein
LVREIRIYIEGGGSGSGSRAIREGFSRFFADKRVHIVVCGSRSQAFEDFKLALKTGSEAMNLLLVDSEGLVSGEPWQHLWNQDHWEKPSGAANEQCHLMVRTVESWLVADPDTLALFYGKGFLRKALPKNVDIESVPKTDIMKALSHATLPTQKGKYHKITHCSKLLSLLDKEKVRRKAKHCDRLLKFLEQHLPDPQSTSTPNSTANRRRQKGVSGQRRSRA